MALETEVKIRVSSNDLERIRTRLVELNAHSLAKRAKEENLLFDFPDGNLQKNGCALRLRIYGQHGILTFKGRVQDDPRFKTRPEHETIVADPQALRNILAGLGLKVSFEYAKFREIYRLDLANGHLEVCLDETPIGTFVELEGDPELIVQAAEKLGWSENQFITATYVELINAKEDDRERKGEK